VLCLSSTGRFIYSVDIISKLHTFVLIHSAGSGNVNLTVWQTDGWANFAKGHITVLVLLEQWYSPCQIHRVDDVDACVMLAAAVMVVVVVVTAVAAARVFIPGRLFPGRPGIPVIFCSWIPGNGAASFPAKTGTVLLMALLSFSIIVACSRGASSALAWWVTAGCCHTATGVIRLDGVLHPAALCSTRQRVGAITARQFALLAVWLTAQVAVAAQSAVLWSVLCRE